ncbi:ATP-binding protein, partial [Burkholderia sp. AW49-1]
HLINKVAAVARYHHTGIIAIDEIQFAVNGAARRGDMLMDFFVTFSNVVGVPLLLAGTPRALSLFEKSFRLARRTGDHGAIIYTNMAFDAEWEHFLTGLFEFQWTRKPAVLDEAFSKALYDVTQGIHSLVIRLFQLAQITAIQDGSEKMTASLIRHLAKDRFGPVQPMIAALRSKKKKRIEQYDDLLVETLAGLDEEVTQNARAAQVKQATERRQSNSAQLAAVSSLVTMQVPQPLALKAVLAVLADEPELSGPQLVKAALLRTEATAMPTVRDFSVDRDGLTDIVRGAANAEEALERLHRAGVLA